MSIVKRIRLSLGFCRLLDADLLARARSILAGLTGNSAYPALPVDLAAFERRLQAFSDAISAAMDGSRRAIAERQKLRLEILSDLRLMAAYVENACKGDRSVLLSSGFEAAPSMRTPAQPLPVPAITGVDQGQTGQLLVNIKAVPKARSYELRYGIAENGGAPAAWASTPVAAVRRASVANLKPGTVYAFQVRAVNRAGCTDWSGPVFRMCI
jgi:hypothetical protein